MVFAVELKVWLGKHRSVQGSLQEIPSLAGGIPVDRSASHGVVGECVRAFEEAPSLMLALAPEGTRKGVSQWKTGFYLIAAKAGVPIMPVGFDYGEHVVRLMPLFHPSGNLEQDLPLIKALFSDVHGCRQRSTEKPKE